MNLNHPNYPDELSQADRASLADRIRSLTAKDAAAQRRSPLLESLYSKDRASDVFVQMTIADGGLHDGYTYTCVVEEGSIALSITLKGAFTDALKLKVHAIAQALFQDLGIERVSIGDRDERLRVNYYWCWMAQGWVVEELEATV